MQKSVLKLFVYFYQKSELRQLHIFNEMFVYFYQALDTVKSEL